jgi:hypothetical protein
MDKLKVLRIKDKSATLKLSGNALGQGKRNVLKHEIVLTPFQKRIQKIPSSQEIAGPSHSFKERNI